MEFLGGCASAQHLVNACGWHLTGICPSSPVTYFYPAAFSTSRDLAGRDLELRLGKAGVLPASGWCPTLGSRAHVSRNACQCCLESEGAGCFGPPSWRW